MGINDFDKKYKLDEIVKETVYFVQQGLQKVI